MRAGANESRKCLTATSKGSVIAVKFVFEFHFISSPACIENFPTSSDPILTSKYLAPLIIISLTFLFGSL